MERNYRQEYFYSSVLEATNKIERVSNFPIDGVTFLNWFPIMKNPEALSSILNALLYRIKEDIQTKPTIILAVEARGFLLGPTLAHLLGTGLVVARRPDKLPGELIRIGQKTEYGEGALAIQKNAVTGKKVLIIDDVFATLGTIQCLNEVIEMDGGEVVGVAGLIDLLYCEKTFEPTYPLISLYTLSSPDGKFAFQKEQDK